MFCSPGNNCLSSPVVGADLFYFFLKHRAIVLGSAAFESLFDSCPDFTFYFVDRAFRCRQPRQLNAWFLRSKFLWACRSLPPLAIGWICVTFFNITKQRERSPLPRDDDFYTTEVKNPFKIRDSLITKNPLLWILKALARRSQSNRTLLDPTLRNQIF